MAKILFKGSTHSASVDRSAILGASEALGYVGAERGHTLLVGSESANTVDHQVKLGVDRFCRAFSQRAARLEIHRPDDGKAPFTAPGAPNLQIERQVYAVSTP